MPLDEVSPLPRPASGRITTPTTSGPDGPPAQAAPLQQLANALGGAAQPERQAALAEDLLSRLDGGHLSLRWMEGADRDAVYALPAKAWALLNAACPGGLHTVDLPTPRDNQQLGRVIEGLNQLTGLRALNLPVPETGVRIHLHELNKGDGDLTVRLDCWRPAGWRMTVPAGSKVETRGVATHPVKPSRQTADGKGVSLGKPAALDGIVYFHQPKDFADTRKDARVWAGTQQAVIDANLNAQVPFAETKASDSRGAAGRKLIVCRHLALQWLTDRAAGRKAWYGNYHDAKAIARHVPASTESAIHEMRKVPADVLVPIDRLGEALHAQFRTMTPGDQRLFYLSSENHAMALDLRLKPGSPGEPPQCVVNFYDPNATLTHERVTSRSLDRIKSLSLRTFTGSGTETYFDPGSLQVAALQQVHVNRPESRMPASPGQCIGFGPHDRVTAGYLHQALRSGQAPAVAQSVRDILSATGPAEPEVRLAAVSSTFPGLAVALQEERADAAMAYVAELLDAPTARLPARTRADLLSLAVVPPTQPRGFTPLRTALYFVPTATGALVRQLLAANPAALPCAMAVALLSEKDDAGVPVLSEAMCLRKVAPPACAQGLREGIYHFVHEILAATSLPVDDAQRLIVARHPASGQAAGAGGLSACEAAIRAGRHVNAGALVCAILEAPATQSLRQELLKALDVDLAALLERLAASTEPDASQWLARIAAALPDSGLAAATVATVLAPYPQLIAHPHPRQSPQALALLPPDTLAAFDATVHTDTVFREAGLRPLRLDSNPSLMVCGAQREIPGLEGYRLRTGTRQGPDMQFEGIRYLLPLERLRPIYEQTRAQAQARPWRDALDVAHPALQAGQMLHHTDACMAHVERALSCPDGARDDLALRRWLLSRPLNDGPMLHAMATSPTSHAPAGKRAQAIHDFVCAIVRSERLSLADKCDLLKVGHAFEGGFGTAAQAALASGRPDAAAAMACAVLESGRPDRECAELLKALGVKLAETLRAPASGKSLEAGDWTARVLDGVQKVKLPQEDTVMPVLLRAGELGLGLKLSSKSAPRADQKHAS